MKSLLIRTFLVQLLIVHMLVGQERVDVRQLPRPDCNGAKIYAVFDQAKDKLLVLPDSTADSAAFTSILGYMKAGWSPGDIRRESQLEESDYERPLLIYGPITGFRHWERFDVPIQKTMHGFAFRGKEYSGTNDGLTYISSNRFVYTGNSSSVIWQLQRTMTSYYRSFLIEDGLLSRIEFEDQRVIDIAMIRRSNYQKLSSRFFNLFVDRTLGLSFEPDSIVAAICAKMKLPLPSFRVTAYVHADPNLARLFSNFFFVVGCDELPDSVTFGTSQFGSIHTVGMDYFLLRHESFHILWEGLVGDSGGNSFFDEGVEQYYEILSDPHNGVNALSIARRNTTIDLETLVARGSGTDFWNGPAENNWPVAYSYSGLFVKFLVDRWGEERFKEYFLSTSKGPATETIYHMSLPDLLAEFRRCVVD
jgi:hypothetical protein